MSNPQKAKGSSWEREVARDLSRRYGESFIRAQGSGAYVGGKNLVRKDSLSEDQVRSFKGDIVPGESFPRLNAECKSYKDFPFHQLLQGPSRILDSWLDQLMTVSDAEDFNILFMKFNRKGQFVAVQFNDKLDLSQSHIFYNSSHHGAWIVYDYGQFWDRHADIVRSLCGQGK